MVDFENMLREHQLKATFQRLSILSEIERCGHIDVEALHTNIKKSFPTMALGTLYRNLNDLVEKGILAEVQIPQQKQKYELVKTPHAHLVCEVCDSVVDVDADLHGVINSIGDKGKFHVLGTTVVLSGVCESCQKGK